MFRPGGNAQVSSWRGASLTLSLAPDSGSAASLCITCSFLVQNLRNESEGYFKGIWWVMTPLSYLSCECPMGVVEGFTAEPVCLRKDGYSLCLTRGYDTQKTFLLFPWLWTSVCKPGLSRWLCELWPLPPLIQPRTIFWTAVVFVFLLDTFFSLSWACFLIDPGWLNNSVTFILSQIPLGNLTQFKVPVRRHLWGEVGFSDSSFFIHIFAIMDKSPL